MARTQVTSLQADLQVQLTSTGDNVFTTLIVPCLHAWVGLGQTLQAFNELGQVLGIFDIDGDLYDRRDRVLHDLHVVVGFRGGEGGRLEHELIATDKTDNVASWAILNRLDNTAHHQHVTLDGLDEEILI